MGNAECASEGNRKLERRGARTKARGQGQNEGAQEAGIGTRGQDAWVQDQGLGLGAWGIDEEAQGWRQGARAHDRRCGT